MDARRGERGDRDVQARRRERRRPHAYPFPVTDYQVTFWRDLPSLVVAKDGEQSVKAQLAARFQGAIDEAAMRLGEVSSDDYLAGWRRGDWTPAEGDPTAVLARVISELEADWPAQALTDYLDALTAAEQQ
jgi:hypothetical protein